MFSIVAPKSTRRGPHNSVLSVLRLSASAVRTTCISGYDHEVIEVFAEDATRANEHEKKLDEK